MKNSIKKEDLQPTKQTYKYEDVLSQFKERGKALQKKATKFTHWVPIFILCVGFFAISTVFVYTIVPKVPIFSLVNFNTTELSTVREMNSRLEDLLNSSDCEYGKRYLDETSNISGHRSSHEDIVGTSQRGTWYMNFLALGFMTVGPVVNFARHNWSHPCKFKHLWNAVLYICPWLVVLSSMPLVLFSYWIQNEWDWLRPECTIAIMCSLWLMWIMALLTTVPPFEKTIASLKRMCGCKKGPGQDPDLNELLIQSPKKSKSPPKKLQWKWTGEYGIQFWLLAVLPAPFFLVISVELFGVLRSFFVPAGCHSVDPDLRFTYEVDVIERVVIYLTIWGALAATFLVLLFFQLQINFRNQRDYRVGKIIQQVGEVEHRTTWKNDPRIPDRSPTQTLLKKAVAKFQTKHVVQESRHIDELYCEASAVNTWFHEEINKVCNNTTLKLPAQDQKTSKIEPKQPERAIDKVHLSYFSAAELCDIVRGSIECVDLDQVLETFKHFENNQNRMEISNVKNKFDKEKEKKEYRSLHLNVKLRGYNNNYNGTCNCRGHSRDDEEFTQKCRGHIAEIQIKLTPPNTRSSSDDCDVNGEKEHDDSEGFEPTAHTQKQSITYAGQHGISTQIHTQVDVEAAYRDESRSLCKECIWQWCGLKTCFEWLGRTEETLTQVPTRVEIYEMKTSFRAELNNNDAAAYLRRVRQAYRHESRTSIINFYYTCKFYILKWFWYSGKSSERLKRTEEKWTHQGNILKQIINNEQWDKKGHDLYKISRFLLKQ